MYHNAERAKLIYILCLILVEDYISCDMASSLMTNSLEEFKKKIVQQKRTATLATISKLIKK